MRYRVDLRYGHASFDESEKDRAFELYEREGIRIRACIDLHDDGYVIEGAPIGAKWGDA